MECVCGLCFPILFIEFILYQDFKNVFIRLCSALAEVKLQMKAKSTVKVRRIWQLISFQCT